MEPPHGYQSWKQLFDGNLSEAWNNEPVCILKNFSMLLCCINQEYSRLQKSLQENIGNQFVDNYLNCKTVTLSGESRKLINSYSQNSKNSTDKCESDNDNGSIMICENEFCSVQNISTSPEIKKSSKQSHLKWRKRLKRKLKEEIGEVIIKKNPMDKEAPDKDVFEDVEFIKNLVCPSKKMQLKSENEKHLNLFEQKSEDDDLDIIESTPVSKTVRQKLKIPKQRVDSRNQDHDHTPTSSTITSNVSEFDSLMGVTNMVRYINQDTLTHSRTDENIDPDLGDSLNSGMLEEQSLCSFQEDYSPEPKKDAIKQLRDLNNFLAEAQNVSQEYEAAPVVRGKNRQKLPAWGCVNCAQYYMDQGVKPDDLLVLKRCMKHRGKYRPREDTLPGYWDMTLRATPDES
ncbi:uncharacterized protein [Euwallacea fornicatus]|uniref:uncharacterized protein n=1 Tax=Euwallacea fornicatus TaxID=995702 RepID=UPI00338DE67B